jgi:hypothetical protein
MFDKIGGNGRPIRRILPLPARRLGAVHAHRDAEVQMITRPYAQLTGASGGIGGFSGRAPWGILTHPSLHSLRS